MIDQYHRSIGFGGMGYHIVVFASGRAYWVSDFGIWGANVQGMNRQVLGIVAVGYFDTYIPQAAQLDGMAWGIVEMWKYRGVQVPQRPHRYWGGTECPGKRYLEWQPQLTARALALEDDMGMTEKIVQLERQVAALNKRKLYEQHVGGIIALAEHLAYRSRLDRMAQDLAALRKAMVALEADVKAGKAAP